jgi:nucleotide-binding universal stress UspA family protein
VIVAAVDRSPAAAQAARLLAGYRGDRRALSVALLNVQRPPLGDWPAGTAELHSLDEALRREGLAELEEARALLSQRGLQVEATVRLGAVAGQIIEEAARRDAAALVIGTRGHGVLRGFAFGSAALRVAHGARSPVLLVQPDTRLPAGLGRSLRVLVALDGSAHATRAVAELLARESWLGRLELELVHVRPAPGLRERFAPPEQALLDEWGTLEAEQASRDARAALYMAGRPFRVHEPAGDAALELVRLVDELDADLVAMGTRGFGALHHALVGSVALKVAIGSPVPVMLVP